MTAEAWIGSECQVITQSEDLQKMRVFTLICLALGAVTSYSSKELSVIVHSSVADAFSNGNIHGKQEFIQYASDVILRLIANPKNGKKEKKSREQSRDERFFKSKLQFRSDLIFKNIASSLENVALRESSDRSFQKILNLLEKCHKFVNYSESLSEIISKIRKSWFGLRHGAKIQEFRVKEDWLGLGAAASEIIRDAKKMGFSDNDIDLFKKSIFNDEGVYQVLKNMDDPNAVNYMQHWKQVHQFNDELEFRRNAAKAKLKGIVKDAITGILTFVMQIGDLRLPISISYDGIQYSLKKFLGSGRDGAAFEAKVEDGEDAVVKFVKNNLREEDSFKKEIEGLRITQRLIHADIENRILIFKMVPGITFAQYLSELAKKYNSETGLSDLEFQDLIQKVRGYFSSMKAFYDKYGLIHGDVRPLNTIITPDGTMELIDLGSCERATSDPRINSQMLQFQCDMSKLELYFWVSWALIRSKEPSMDEEYRHLLILKANPGREADADEFCNFFMFKYKLSPQTCENLENDHLRLRERVQEVLSGPLPAVEELHALGVALRERFMFTEDGQLKQKLSSLQ